MGNQYFSHSCGLLTAQNIGQTVIISGWIERKRDHGPLLFIDLNDHDTGVVQCVVDMNNQEAFRICDDLSVASVITVHGEVHFRPEGTTNMEITSGMIDVKIKSVIVISKSDPLPLQECTNEEKRLQFRYLDLRRQIMKERLELRSNLFKEIRQAVEEEGFMEVHTPLLTSSSPEGARDYIVPSRMHKGEFYALPQSPQQFKQLLMVAGVRRYYQIAPCFRDEDTRSDRAPGAFYQLDMEMAFVTQEEVFEVTERIMHRIFSKFSIFEVDIPFPRMTYAETIKKYGTDKPDLRNPLVLVDIFDLMRDNPPRIFAETIAKNGKIALIEYNSSNTNRNLFDDMNKFAQSIGAKGLGYLERDGDSWKGSLANVMPQSVKDIIKHTSKGAFVIAHENPDEFNKIAAQIRDQIGRKLDLIERNRWCFCWITDFPMYELNEKGGWDFSHNPFSMPQGGLEALKTKSPGDILAWQYDLVCNGYELSSGAVRNHHVETMYKAFEIAGYSKESVDKKFGAMINAFRYGAPPHAGIAPGIERMLMLLGGVKNLREIIPFPLSQAGKDLMMNAPSTLNKEQLDDLGIAITKKKS